MKTKSFNEFLRTKSRLHHAGLLHAFLEYFRLLACPRYTYVTFNSSTRLDAAGECRHVMKPCLNSNCVGDCQSLPIVRVEDLHFGDSRIPEPSAAVLRHASGRG